MSDIGMLKSNEDITGELAGRIQDESMKEVIGIHIFGRTNLRFLSNFEGTLEEGTQVLEAYLETFRSNGAVIKEAGDKFARLDHQYAEEMRGRG